LIDSPDAFVFHVSNDGTKTQIGLAKAKFKRHEILDNLGLLASDLLQANYVIWVEGPSDRILLAHWLRHVDPALMEGIHFSIMFYGGALISHLTVDPDSVEDFIRLADLNRNMAVIMDSDRSKETDPLKPHVNRILEEMTQSHCFVWVTEGREIENYVKADDLQKAVRGVHSRLYDEPCGVGKFDYAYHFMRKKKNGEDRREKFKEVDKVSVARCLTLLPPDLSMLDLRHRLEELVMRIRKANGLLA